MYGFLLTLLILDGILLMVVVLLQAGKGGGLAAMGGAGTDNFIGGRQAANLLTKTSWTTGGLFLALSLVLSIMSSREQQAGSVLQDEFRQGPAPATQPVLPGTTTPAPAEPQGQQAPPPADAQQQQPQPQQPGNR